jgi:hypothetical protein
MLLYCIHTYIPHTHTHTYTHTYTHTHTHFIEGGDVGRQDDFTQHGRSKQVNRVMPLPKPFFFCNAPMPDTSLNARLGTKRTKCTRKKKMQKKLVTKRTTGLTHVAALAIFFCIFFFCNVPRQDDFTQHHWLFGRCFSWFSSPLWLRFYFLCFKMCFFKSVPAYVLKTRDCVQISPRTPVTPI